MDFWDVVVRRRSVRKFDKEEVPMKAIEEIIKTASLAPSGSNAKNWHFIVVKDGKVKEQMCTAVSSRIDELAGKMKSKRAREDFVDYSGYFTFFSEAPVVISVVMKKYDALSVRILKKYDKDSSYTSTAGVQGVSAAVQNMLLACTALGLGACWMTGPLIAKEALEDILGIEGDDHLMSLVPVGIPLGTPSPYAFPEDVSNIMTVI